MSKSDITWKSLDQEFENWTFDLRAASGPNGVSEGRENCAWYESFRYGGDYWGIHIRDWCWVLIANEFIRNSDTATSRSSKTGPIVELSTPNNAIKAAFLYLLFHEYFHYQVDIAAATMEFSAQGKELYLPYMKNVYSATYYQQGALEEALANENAYRRSESYHVSKKYLGGLMKKQGPGYRDFDAHLGENRTTGRRLLMNQLLSGSITPPSPLAPNEQLLSILASQPQAVFDRVPIWLHLTDDKMIKIPGNGLPKSPKSKWWRP